jgi:hypothetical protein
MKALLIEFDLERGKRAGNISPKDAGLKCYGWQDIENRPAKEIRVIEDDRDTKQYEGIEGVTILQSDDEIEAAIEREIPKRYSIQDEMLFQMSVKEKRIKMARFAGKNRETMAKELFEEDVLGISIRNPLKLREVFNLK